MRGGICHGGPCDRTLIAYTAHSGCKLYDIWKREFVQFTPREQLDAGAEPDALTKRHWYELTRTDENYDQLTYLTSGVSFVDLVDLLRPKSQCSMTTEEIAWEVAELVFSLIQNKGGGDNSPIVAGRGQCDPFIRTRYIGFLVAYSRLSPDWPIDCEVEQRVQEIYADMNTVCKPVNDPRYGRCFEVDLFDELQGLSWDQFRNRQMKQG